MLWPASAVRANIIFHLVICVWDLTDLFAQIKVNLASTSKLNSQHTAFLRKRKLFVKLGQASDAALQQMYIE